MQVRHSLSETSSKICQDLQARVALDILGWLYQLREVVDTQFSKPLQPLEMPKFVRNHLQPLIVVELNGLDHTEVSYIGVKFAPEAIV